MPLTALAVIGVTIKLKMWARVINKDNLIKLSQNYGLQGGRIVESPLPNENAIASEKPFCYLSNWDARWGRIQANDILETNSFVTGEKHAQSQQRGYITLPMEKGLALTCITPTKFPTIKDVRETVRGTFQIILTKTSRR